MVALSPYWGIKGGVPIADPQKQLVFLASFLEELILHTEAGLFQPLGKEEMALAMLTALP